MKAATPSDDIGDKTPHVDFSLNGKSALVTGAARGIGQAICAALAAAGADVMGVDICAVAAPNLTYPPATEEQLAQTGRMVEGARRLWIPVKADIRDPKAMEAATDRAVKEFGKLDIVVANAGIQAYGSMAEMPQADWDNVIDINVKGTANTVRPCCRTCFLGSMAASLSYPQGRVGMASRMVRLILLPNGPSSV
jgi:NAD(P)-dependent dehydrogenase (short-subunit alcohol dehydrogenase family)